MHAFELCIKLKNINFHHFSPPSQFKKTEHFYSYQIPLTSQLSVLSGEHTNLPARESNKYFLLKGIKKGCGVKDESPEHTADVWADQGLRCILLSFYRRLFNIKALLYTYIVSANILGM